MAEYFPGDVVKVIFPYSDLKGYKCRPGIVLLKYESDDKYLICEVNSLKEKHSKLTGIKVLLNSEIGKQMGVLEDSFINHTSKARIRKKQILEKIGSYLDFKSLL